MGLARTLLDALHLMMMYLHRVGPHGRFVDLLDAIAEESIHRTASRIHWEG